METNKKIQRIPYEGAIAGVCAGLGEYFGVDKTWVRVGFILTIFFAGSGVGFVGPLLYIILWVVLPVKPVASPRDLFDVDYRAESPIVASASDGDAYAGSYDRFTQPLSKSKQKSKSDQTTAGIILLGIGVFFLLHQFDVFYWRDMVDYWPVLLIFMGLVNIVTAFRIQKPRNEGRGCVKTHEKENPSSDGNDGTNENVDRDQGESSQSDEPKN